MDWATSKTYVKHLQNTKSSSGVIKQSKEYVLSVTEWYIIDIYCTCIQDKG